VEENKAILRRFIEAYNSRNLEMFDELVASDFVDYTSATRAGKIQETVHYGF